MIQVSIIGSGNVAQHLAMAFAKSDAVQLMQVYSRRGETIPGIDASQLVSDYAQLKVVDLYIIAVSDTAITEVSAALPFENRFVVHTSGSLPLDAADAKNRRGVFYPLQTFTKNKAIDFESVPLCLETENERDFQLLKQTAEAISGAIFRIDSQQRKALHVAAVFASNFTNHMYAMAEQICIENDISFDILKPLIRETAAKITVLSPTEAQTGPARRHDDNTIEAHLAMLDEKRSLIYKILTQSIQDHGRKL